LSGASSSHIAFKAANAAAKPSPKIQAKYHISCAPCDQ
jgi:hypothetical protein